MGPPPAGVLRATTYAYDLQGKVTGITNALNQYDDFDPGSLFKASSLEPFTLHVDDFNVDWLHSGPRAGMATGFQSKVTYCQTCDGQHDKTYDLRVNHPLSIDGARVYLLGHGYAPVLRYTDRYGNTQTIVAPFLYVDDNKTSTGVVEFPDANVDPVNGRDPADPQQVAFAGVYVPTSDGQSDVSVYPAERNPVLVVTPYRGDLGVDSGVPSSVYSLNQHQIATGKLRALSAPLRLRPGQSTRLDDGTTVQFVGTRPWTALTVRYDPGETVVLVGAVCLLVGLLASLTGRRRRVWFRVPPSGAVSAGALARAEYPGFRTEFDTIIKEVQ